MYYLKTDTRTAHMVTGVVIATLMLLILMTATMQPASIRSALTVEAVAMQK